MEIKPFWSFERLAELRAQLDGQEIPEIDSSDPNCQGPYPGSFEPFPGTLGRHRKLTPEEWEEEWNPNG